MDIRLNRADCKQLCQLGTLGLAIAFAPLAQAEPPSDWNVVREPLEPSQLWISEPIEPAILPQQAPSTPAINTRQETMAASSVPVDELPLLPPGPVSNLSAANEERPAASPIATPRRIKPTQTSEGVPANLARLQMQQPRRETLLPTAVPEAAQVQPVAIASRPRRESYDTAIFESTQSTAPMPRRPIQPSTVMPGFGSVSLREQAAKHLDESAARLGHRASLTAGAEATEALRLVAQAKIWPPNQANHPLPSKRR